MCLLAGFTDRGNIMNEVTEKRAAADVSEDLSTKLRDINAVVEIMTACDAEECDVNGAAFAIHRMVEDAKKIADELYHS